MRPFSIFHLVSMFFSWVMVCKLSKKVHFFVLTSPRNLSLLKQFTYMYLKFFIKLFQKMVWLIGVWATVHEILAIKISKKMMTQKFNRILRLQTRKSLKQWDIVFSENNTILWMCVTRHFRCTYVNCFNRIRFLVEVSTKLQKMHFLDNLRTITQDGNMGSRQMTLVSSSTFSTLTVCNIHFRIWKNWNFIFNFWPKATDSDSSPYISKK